MAEPRSNENLGELRCFGCGQEPRAGVIERRADGSNCPSCASRVLEEQPTLLRHTSAANDRANDRANDEGASHETYSTPSLEGDDDQGSRDSTSSPAPLAAGRRLRHLGGGTAPDMHAAPDGHWPNEPA